jgi:hypothetical protein
MSAEKKQIEQTAYRIWEENGRPHGRDMDHWLAAEAEVTAKAPAKTKPAKAAAKPKAEAPKKAAAKANGAAKPKAARAKAGAPA